MRTKRDAVFDDCVTLIAAMFHRCQVTAQAFTEARAGASRFEGWMSNR